MRIGMKKCLRICRNEYARDQSIDQCFGIPSRSALPADLGKLSTRHTFHRGNRPGLKRQHPWDERATNPGGSPPCRPQVLLLLVQLKFTLELRSNGLEGFAEAEIGQGVHAAASIEIIRQAGKDREFFAQA